jgi:hypothetical protein
MQKKKMNKALFISNEKFLSNSFAEGGVKLCTDEFLALLNTGFEVTKFPVKYTSGLRYRIKKKLGISVYDDYTPEQYMATLKELLIKDGIKYIFLNLTNTAPFAKAIKASLPEVKVILCSHGNESGDYLHEAATHQSFSGIKKKAAASVLGQMLIEEAAQRQYIDLVLTVSEVEEAIEKWLGAKQVYMVPRHINNVQQEYHPVAGRVGFFSDLSHRPNYYGISEVCKAIETAGSSNITLRLAGGGAERGKELESRYPFVEYLGYLSEEALLQETSSWTFSLNPVFYYSRGVSTKLGKSLSMGLPVITTDKGMRGYKWKTGEMPVAPDAAQMASMIISLSHDQEKQQYYHQQVLQIQQSAPSYETMMADIHSFLSL